MKQLLLPFLLLFSSIVPAAQDTNIRIVLEEPVDDVENTHLATSSGISNLRGWAVAENGIDRIELYVNGDYIDDIPYGGLRADVGEAFPAIIDSANSGFSMAWAYTSLNQGRNTISVKAYDKLGNYNSDTATFSTYNFGTPFISNPDDVDVTGITKIDIIDKNTFTSRGLVANGKQGDLALKWNTATQGFEIAVIGARYDWSPIDDRWEGIIVRSKGTKHCIYNSVITFETLFDSSGFAGYVMNVISSKAPDRNNDADYCDEIELSGSHYENISFDKNHVYTLPRGSGVELTIVSATALSQKKVETINGVIHQDIRYYYRR